LGLVRFQPTEVPHSQSEHDNSDDEQDHRKKLFPHVLQQVLRRGELNRATSRSRSSLGFAG
jgi:hypothetical protein